MIGQFSFPHPPVTVWRSEPQTPQATILTSMSRSPKGLGLNYVADTVRKIGIIAELPIAVPYLMPLGLVPFICRVDSETLEGVWVHSISRFELL